MPDVLRVERRPLDELPGPAYDRLAARSFFASRGFLDLWRRTGGRPVAWTVETDGGLAAALPGVEFGRRPLARFAALPDGLYGRLLVEPARAADAGACARAALGAITRHGYGRVHIFDFHGSIGRGEGFEVRPCSTRIVSLEAPDWPEDPKLRSQIRKAGREGISVVPYDPARHRAGLLALVARTFRHHGLRPRYPASFYDALAALAARDPRVIWRWCERDGEPASSHIYFVEGDMLLAWQSYFDRRFSFLKPNVHIRHGAAREAAARGVRWLNLGATPETATGLAYFKARWGGRRVSFASLAQLTGPAAAFEGWRARRRIERVRDVLGPAKALR